MASRYIALIRGVNVGRAKRVAMVDLRLLMDKLGYSDVRTLLNSGNIVFTAPRDVRGDGAERIEEAMAKQLGVSVRVTVLTAAEIALIVRENPLGDVATNSSRLLVAVLRNPMDRKKLEPLTKMDWGHEALGVGRRVAYLWCPNSIIDSPLARTVNRALGDGVTARNWATILKLQAMARE